MDKTELQALQKPLKDKYRDDPASALVTLRAEGALDGEAIACSVATGRALVDAGLHPATGGTGVLACSGDMLLEALVACAGVTLRSVATSLEIPVAGTVRAEGDLDFRGTLGVDREAPVGFRAIRLTFALDHQRDRRADRDAAPPHRALLRRPSDDCGRRPGRGLAGRVRPTLRRAVRWPSCRPGRRSPRSGGCGASPRAPRSPTGRRSLRRGRRRRTRGSGTRPRPGARGG